jgi:drug/metabolite transporter (DMT)-like permease
MANPLLYVVIGSFCAAAGQIFLKLGATGATAPIHFLNARMATGFLLYAAGSVLWVMALAKLPLSRVYPFTVLTFVVVYAASIFVLGETVSSAVIVGALLVLAGLIVIAVA